MTTYPPGQIPFEIPRPIPPIAQTSPPGVPFSNPMPPGLVSSQNPNPLQSFVRPHAPASNPLATPNPMRSFKSKICSFWVDGRCKKGEGCQFAHGEHELRQSSEVVSGLAFYSSILLFFFKIRYHKSLMTSNILVKFIKLIK